MLMIKLFVPIVSFLILISATVFGQNSNIKIKFKNNSYLPHRYTFVIYKANQKTNATIGKFLGPNTIVIFELTEGSKVYLADSKDVDMVMSGNVLEGPPFYIVSKSSSNKIVNLIK